MKKYDKLIFVSGSNTLTSPMAEAVLQSRYVLEDILVESRGLVVLFPEPVNPKAEAVLVSNGLSMKEHMSRPLSKDDFDDRTLILTMNQSQKETVLADYDGAKNVFTFAEYIHEEGEVTVPYGGSLSDYGRCFEQIREWISRLEEVLDEGEKRS